MGKLFSVHETASLLGLHAKTVERWCRQGEIAAVRLGTRWRVSAQELERIAREGVPPARSETGRAAAIRSGSGFVFRRQ